MIIHACQVIEHLHICGVEGLRLYEIGKDGSLLGIFDTGQSIHLPGVINGLDRAVLLTNMAAFRTSDIFLLRPGYFR